MSCTCTEMLNYDSIICYQVSEQYFVKSNLSYSCCMIAKCIGEANLKPLQLIHENCFQKNVDKKFNQKCM